MSISSAGIGSGIDVNTLITQLVEAEGVDKSNRLDFNEAEYLGDISAFGSLKSALSIFQGAVRDLQDTADFQLRSALSSNDEVFTATADETADVSQYGIEVVQLAQAHKLITTSGFADTDTIGDGTLTFTQGDDSFSLTIDATDTLTDIRDAINAANDNTGVSASIINVDSGQQLVFTATSSGLDNAITITAVDSDGENSDEFGLSRLVNTQLNTPSAAQDGQIKVDGQLISSNNNTFSDVLDGITINAVSVGAGEQLTVAQDREAITFKIDTFIANYNGLVDTFNTLGSYDAATESAGLLLGDSTLRGISTLIRQEISSSVTGLTGPFSTLAELGITTDEEGKLSLNSETLNAALDSNFDQVGQLFAASNGIANTLDMAIEGYIGSNGIIDSRTAGIQVSVDDIADQREALDRRLVSLESRLLSQFTAMDILVSSLQNQSNFLTQQLANLPGAYNSNSNN
ncbi:MULTISPECIES: flagellar filament capping protein FliD [Cycloclasticus]|jgi:flagellar hook-associated protein 2|uniref:Flagellar hook-associated protein 2 n=1 Tax=Cycloclasticus zancles 78-ME TaxID=1198232 RepID=S5TF07_9GAMM|nr:MULTISPECIES: flagellar filament capping protein FliD [Cycloclasticus]AGS39397.1 Flagellar hook-associated protein FliD [Cycloclasticus zancles 78-ME]SHI41192.1 flagellar hook-associated protein 2 [Cycloclasticus pugetii]